jgi:hypothetical protein
MPITLKVSPNTTTVFSGEAPAGSTLEAVDLSYAAANRMAIDEYREIGKADATGKFSLPAGTFLTNTAEGDYVRLRAKDANGKVLGVVTVRLDSTTAVDTTNAPIVERRLALYDDGSGTRAILAANDLKRPASEPFAKIKITNQRTNAKVTVKLDADGHFPANFSVAAKPGDVLAFAVSDGTNNKKLTTTATTYAVVGRIPHANDIADPAVHHDQADSAGRPKVGSQLFTGDLFVNGPSASDVGQRYIADCYLPAALASLAQLSPQTIENLIKKNADDSYTVTFKTYDWQTRSYKDKKVTIDGDLYVDGNGQPIYGAGLPAPNPAATQMELWFPLLEKAYAAFKGSYEAIGNGGSPADVLSAVLGRDPLSRALSNPTQLWNDVKKSVDNKVASSFCTDKDDARYEGTGIHADHCYSILDYRTTADGKREVLVRNPWGYDEPGADGNDDGSFWYSVEDCVAQFTYFFTVR